MPRPIIVLSPKGGAGKSTLATLIADHLASPRQPVSLVDTDPQGTALAWAHLRASPNLRGVRARMGAPLANDGQVVVDTPPWPMMQMQLPERGVVVATVKPSPADLAALARVVKQGLRIDGVVLNEAPNATGPDVRAATAFLSREGLRVIVVVRARRCYVRALASGSTPSETAAVNELKPLWKFLKVAMRD